MKLYVWYDLDSFVWIVITAESVEAAREKYLGKCGVVYNKLPKVYDIDNAVILRGRDPQ